MRTNVDRVTLATMRESVQLLITLDKAIYPLSMVTRKEDELDSKTLIVTNRFSCEYSFD